MKNTNKARIIPTATFVLFAAILVFNGLMFFKIGDLQKSNGNLISEIDGQIQSISVVAAPYPDYSSEIENLITNLLNAYAGETNELLATEINRLYERLNEMNTLIFSLNEDNYDLLMAEIGNLNKMISDIDFTPLLAAINNQRTITENAVPLSSGFDTTPAAEDTEEKQAENDAENKQAENEVNNGQVVTLFISAQQVSDMYGYQFRLYFNKDDFEYSGGLSSGISEIPTIFAKEFDSYVLVGATKIGDAPGFSGENTNICQVRLTAKRDLTINDFLISDVNVVKSDLTYIENITGWSVSIG